MLRVGHIGWLGTEEGPGYKTVAWCDINAAKLQAQASRHPGIATYTDYREMLRKANLDIVMIASPNFCHAEQAIAFLDAGVHVFLEKPMGATVAECDRILAAWKRSGRNLGIDFEVRVSPFAQRIKALINSGEYGSLRRIEYIHHQGAWLAGGPQAWRLRPETTGGLLPECPIHYIDIFRLFAGEVDSVQSVAGPNVLPQYGIPDNICSHFFFENGVLATLLTTHTHSAVPRDEHDWRNTADYMAPMGHDMSMIFTLTGGSIAVDFLRPAVQVHRFEEWPPGSRGVRVVQERVEDYRALGMMAFFHDCSLQRNEFLRRCVEGLPPVQDPVDAWRTHRATFAAEQSARENGRRIQVDYALPF